MKLLLTGIEPPEDIASWSGSPYHLSQALRKEFDLCFFGGLRGSSATFHAYVEKFHRRLKLPGTYRVRAEPGVLKEFARHLEEVIRREKPDAVLSINCEPIAYLKPGLPVYIIHDATIRLLSNSYRHFQVMCQRSQRTSEEAQKLGFARVTVTLPASEWASRSAREDYGLPAAKVRVIPMGANLLAPPSAADVAEAIEARLASDTVHFLFVGVEWGRKGGDTAVSIVEALVRKGLKATLHLVGCAPPPGVADKPFITAHGFLSKSNRAQAVVLWTLFKTAHFFIVPSVAECYGCVFCEAAAFGVPTIARATGGIPDIVQDGVTGSLLSPDLPQDDLVDLVFDLARDPERYRHMALRARHDYETRLNWDAYVRTLKEVIQASCPKPDNGAAR